MCDGSKVGFKVTHFVMSFFGYCHFTIQQGSCPPEANMQLFNLYQDMSALRTQIQTSVGK